MLLKGRRFAPSDRPAGSRSATPDGLGPRLGRTPASTRTYPATDPNAEPSSTAGHAGTSLVIPLLLHTSTIAARPTSTEAALSLGSVYSRGIPEHRGRLVRQHQPPAGSRPTKATKNPQGIPRKIRCARLSVALEATTPGPTLRADHGTHSVAPVDSASRPPGTTAPEVSPSVAPSRATGPDLQPRPGPPHPRLLLGRLTVTPERRPNTTRPTPLTPPISELAAMPTHPNPKAGSETPDQYARTQARDLPVAT